MKKILLITLIILIMFIPILLMFAFNFTLVKQETINSNYQLSDKLKKEILAETKNLDDFEIAKYCVEFTANYLSFKEKNDISNKEANCIGYSELCKSLCNYVYKVNNRNVKVNHVRGYIKCYNINLCNLLKILVPNNYKNFVKDHDFVEIYINNEYIYMDPTLLDLLNTDGTTIINNN